MPLIAICTIIYWTQKFNFKIFKIFVRFRAAQLFL